MRIAVPIHSFEPGGVERVALNLCAAWQQAGEEVTVVLGREDGAMRDPAPPLDYAVLPEPVPTAAFETLWMVRVMRRYLARARADVVFASGNTYGIIGVAMKLLLGRHCPPVAIKLSNDLYRRDMMAPYRMAYHWWLRVQGRWLDHFVGMAQPMRAEIAELMRVPEAKITIIEDPSLEERQFAALAALPRSEALPRAPHYVAVGRLARQKNFPLLLRAFARLRDPAARLTIVGEGGERGKLERLADRLGIADRLAMPGHVADPLPYLAQASAFVLSSDGGLTIDLMPAHVRGLTPSRIPRQNARTSDQLCRELVSMGMMAAGESDNNLYERIVSMIEKELIAQVLKSCGGVQTRAATRLGINRNTLHKKLSEYRLDDTAGPAGGSGRNEDEPGPDDLGEPQSVEHDVAQREIGVLHHPGPHRVGLAIGRDVPQFDKRSVRGAGHFESPIRLR